MGSFTVGKILVPHIRDKLLKLMLNRLPPGNKKKAQPSPRNMRKSKKRRENKNDL